MKQRVLVVPTSAAFGVCLAAAPEVADGPVKLTAPEIVDKNVAARSGLEGWRAVKTMSLSGELGVGGNQQAVLDMPGQRNVKPETLKQAMAARPLDEGQLPFLMGLARPRKMRFEFEFAGQTTVQVYDGVNGWNPRPFRNRQAVESYTADEMKISSAHAELDGPLVDYAAKGTRIEMAGTEKVEIRDTYKIKMTLKSGERLHVWIDAETFVEARIGGSSRSSMGRPAGGTLVPRLPAGGGLQIPYILETRVPAVGRTATGSPSSARANDHREGCGESQFRGFAV